MAFKLTKQELARKQMLLEELVKHYTIAKEAIEDYNEAVQNCKEFAEIIAEQASEDIADKSERWQEGERGQAAEAWKNEYANFDFNLIEFDDIEDALTTFEELPEVSEEF